MTLESILKPLKIIDEEVLRSHTIIAQYAEDQKGISKQALSDILCTCAFTLGGGYSVLGIMSITKGLDEFKDSYLTIMRSLTLARIAGVGSYLNAIAVGRDFENESSGDSIAVNQITHYTSKISRVFRLPGLVTGLSSIGYSIIDTLSANGNLLDNLDMLFVSTFVTLGASALYIKDADPKLLDKQPLLKRIYNNVKEKIGSIAPRPRPVPEPVPNLPYATLDSHMHSPN